MRKKLFFIFLWAVILCLPLFLSVSTTFPRLDTDYDSNLPVYLYIVNFIKSFHAFPFSIPLVNSGISTLGDPLNSFLNPLLGLPFIFFGINMGLRISIFLSCLLSGVTMCLLLKKYIKSSRVILFGSLLYMSGGSFFAAVASGHIEKFLIYPFVPLLFLFSLKRELKIRDCIALGLIFAAAIYSGDFYSMWFFSLIFLSIRGFYIYFENNKQRQFLYILITYALFVLFSLTKLIPFYTDVLFVMKRFSDINPFAGSIQLFFFPLTYVMPLGVWFWDRPFFQRHLGFYYNWYEYFAFITPFPFLFLFSLKNVLKRIEVKITLVVLLVGTFYFSLAYQYSPFYWIFHAIPIFSSIRVPQRIVLPMTSIVIFLLCICMENFSKRVKRQYVFILIFVSLLWVAMVDWNILKQTFPTKSTQNDQIIAEFAKINSEKAPTTVFTAQETQYKLFEKNIPISNYYYGWISKDTENYISNGFAKLIERKPKYVILNSSILLTRYGYTSVLKNATIAVWQRH